MLPYTLSQQQYGVPAALTFQATPKPNRPLTREQELDYRMQSGFKGPGLETLSKFLLRMEFRIRHYRFYFLPPLYLALVAFLFRLRERRYAWVAAICLLFALGINFFPAFQLHYLAAIVCLFVLISIAGLQKIGPNAARMIVMLCCAHFLFWYGLHVADNSALSRFMLPYETWDGINHGNPEHRIAVRNQLAQIPGQLLVFVRYFPQHVFQEEWVFNGADIDNSRIVWARDLGPVENQETNRVLPEPQSSAPGAGCRNAGTFGISRRGGSGSAAAEGTGQTTHQTASSFREREVTAMRVGAAEVQDGGIGHQLQRRQCPRGPQAHGPGTRLPETICHPLLRWSSAAWKSSSRRVFPVWKHHPVRYLAPLPCVPA